MNQYEGPSARSEDDGQASLSEAAPDIELELGISPDDVLSRISAAVENDRLALHQYDRLASKAVGGRVLAEKYVFQVTEGNKGLNALTIVCEGRVEPHEKGSSMEVRFQMRSAARLFLFVWAAFAFVISAYEIVDAWPGLPSWHMLAGIVAVTIVAVGLFVAVRKSALRQEVRMRAVLKDILRDTILYMRERPVAT
jgi:hypothetical protein